MPIANDLPEVLETTEPERLATGPLLPAMDIPATWKTPLTSIHRATNAKAMKVILLTPTHRPMNTTVMRETRDTPVLRGIYHRSI